MRVHGSEFLLLSDLIMCKLPKTLALSCIIVSLASSKTTLQVVNTRPASCQTRTKYLEGAAAKLAFANKIGFHKRAIHQIDKEVKKSKQVVRQKAQGYATGSWTHL